MTRRVILRQRAQDDLRSVFRWYESRRPGLGEHFSRQLKSGLKAFPPFRTRIE